jgi:Cu+-exporting ATPase
VGVSIEGQVAAIIEVADRPRADSARAVAALRELGLTSILLTGDRLRTAEVIADEVGIGTVIADATPDAKLAAIVELQSQGQVVAMAGDGINDAIGLAQADLGIAMGSGTDLAREASDITVMRPSLMGVVDAIRLSRRTLAIIKGNLFWAFAYNVAAIPLAMAGLLNPMIAGAAMAFSSVFVVTNSLRLRGFAPTS